MRVGGSVFAARARELVELSFLLRRKRDLMLMTRLHRVLRRSTMYYTEKPGTLAFESTAFMSNGILSPCRRYLRFSVRMGDP
jgi:hypothetical protein